MRLHFASGFFPFFFFYVCSRASFSRTASFNTMCLICSLRERALQGSSVLLLIYYAFSYARSSFCVLWRKKKKQKTKTTSCKIQAFGILIWTKNQLVRSVSASCLFCARLHWFITPSPFLLPENFIIKKKSIRLVSMLQIDVMHVRACLSVCLSACARERFTQFCVGNMWWSACICTLSIKKKEDLCSILQVYWFNLKKKKKP